MKTVRGQTLIASLIVIAIMCVLAVVLLKGSGAFGGAAGSPRKDGKGTTTVGLVKYAAKDDVCRSNLGQVRAAIMICRSNADDQPPADIKETKLPAEFYVCPVGHEKYVYDPVTGTVHCPHPGHEKY